MFRGEEVVYFSLLKKLQLLAREMLRLNTVGAKVTRYDMEELAVIVRPKRIMNYYRS